MPHPHFLSPFKNYFEHSFRLISIDKEVLDRLRKIVGDENIIVRICPRQGAWDEIVVKRFLSFGG
jgi:hypothetical protein